MSGRDDLPGHVAEAPEDVQRAWIEAYDTAVEDGGDDARAHRAANGAIGHVGADETPDGPGGQEAA